MPISSKALSIGSSWPNKLSACTTRKSSASALRSEAKKHGINFFPGSWTPACFISRFCFQTFFDYGQFYLIYTPLMPRRIVSNWINEMMCTAAMRHRLLVTIFNCSRPFFHLVLRCIFSFPEHSEISSITTRLYKQIVEGFTAFFSGNHDVCTVS